MRRYWIGETVRAQCDFSDDDGAPIAVTGLSFSAKSPTGDVIVGTAISTGVTGSYYADFALQQAGVWSLRAACTGPTAAAVEDQVECRSSYVL